MELRDRFDAAATERRGADDETAPPTITKLVARWQETGCHAAFERLVEAVLPEVQRVVSQTLRRRGVRDPAAADDAVALVLDHLRRLAGRHDSERDVARFVPSTGRPQPDSDRGRSYIGCLAQDRARDVLRSLRRQKILPFAHIAADGGRRLEANPEEPAAPLIDRLRAGLTQLEPRQRMLVELLLAGKSQAVIAHVLGLSEGTVSRLRTRAIAALRRLLADE